jgi:hypothetical protein
MTMRDDPAYKALLEKLALAHQFYERGQERNRLYGYMRAVMAAREFFNHIDVHPDLTKIFHNLRNFLFDDFKRSGLEAGRPPRPSDETCALAMGAAVVTVFAKEFGSVEHAIRRCSKIANIEPVKLESFRGNVRKRRLDELSRDLYWMNVDFCKTWSLEWALEVLRREGMPHKKG